MRTLFLLALLFAFFLEPAFASSPIPIPILDSALPAAPMSRFYADPDGILDFCDLCNLCQISLFACSCRKYNPPCPNLNITPSMILDHEAWESSRDLQAYFPIPDPLAGPPIHEQQPAPGEAYTYNRQPLQPRNLQQFNENATTVQPSTVHAHIRDAYYPGDRLESLSSGELPYQPPRRQPPRPGGGFSCEVEDCGKAFDRNCDLKRHQKTHTDDSQRPHKCSFCGKGFLYPKDVARHARTHDDSVSPQSQLRCPVPGCSNTDGFSRRDNLLRHQRKKHPYLLG